jgi:hypothetical protein
MPNVKKRATLCGFIPRAKCIASESGTLTFLWPCGYQRTETATIGKGKLKKPMGPAALAIFSRYWSQGVAYECPRCRRAALAKRREERANG